MSYRPPMAAAALLLWLAAASAGCPDGAETGGPTDECTSIGQQCRLGGGQLGVRTKDADQQFECVSQH